MKIFVLTLFITLVNLQLSLSENVDTFEFERTLALLNDGQRNIVLSEQRDLVLFLGNVDSGKLPLLKWVLGNDEKLFAAPIEDGSLIVVDKHQLGHYIYEKETFIPELALNGSGAYYDCPGFRDAPTISIDISTAYFIQRVAEHAEKIKLVFVIKYSSLKKVEDQNDLMKLLTHAADLIKNIKKFRSSIALIVTKIDNNYSFTDRVLDPDNNYVVREIADYLFAVKNAVANDLTKTKIVQLLEVFLLRDSDGFYPRIGLFHRPRRAGSLLQNDHKNLLQKEKSNIIKILNSLDFTSKRAEDFSYAITARSKGHIDDVAKKIGKYVEHEVERIIEFIVNKFRDTMFETENQLSEFINNDDAAVQTNEEIAAVTNRILTSGIGSVSRMVIDLKNVNNPHEIAEIIRSALSNAKLFHILSILNDELFTISNYGEFVDFLQLVNRPRLVSFSVSTNSWAAKWERNAEGFSKFKRRFDDKISHLTNQTFRAIEILIENVSQSIRRYYDKLFQDLRSKFELLITGNEAAIDPNDVRVFGNNLNMAIKTITFLLKKDTENVSDCADIQQSLNDIIKVDLSAADIVRNIKNKFARLDFLRSFTNATTMKSEQLFWLDEFNSTVQYFLQMRSQFKNDGQKVVEKLVSRVEDLIGTFSEKLNDHYRAQLSRTQTEIESFQSRNSAYGEVDVSKAQEIATNLDNGLTIMSALSARITTLSAPLKLKTIIGDVVVTNISGFHFDQNLINSLSLQVEFLDVLLVTTKLKSPTTTTSRWSTPIQNAWHQLDQSLRSFRSTFLSEISASVNALMKSDVVAAAQRLIDYYEDKLSAADEITLEILEKIESSFSQLLLLLSTATNIQKDDNNNYLFTYLNQVVDCVARLDINRSIIINKVFHRYTFLEYIQAFSDHQLISVEQFNSNFHPLEDALRYLMECPKWNAFLVEVDEKLSQYEIQRDASKYNVAHLDDWGKVNKPQGISINRNNFHQFLTKLNISGGDLIWTLKLSDSRLEALDNVLVLNLRNIEFEKICHESGDKIILQSRFMKFSDFVHENQSFRNPCSFESPNISIFASKTMFVDRGLWAVGSRLNLSIIAPKWEVINGGEIYLSAVHEEDGHTQPAKDGKQPGADGANGAAGVAGGDAGSFFGIGREFIHRNFLQLRIFADGGRGGGGQDGGRGMNGRDGDVVKKSDIDDAGRVNTIIEFLGDKKVKNYREKINKLSPENTCETERSCLLSKGCNCEVGESRSGQKGGNGGKGGAGGDGGRAGNVDLIELRVNASDVFLYNRPGLQGYPGKGGKGGLGGRNQKVQLWYKKDLYCGTFTSNTCVDRLRIKILSETVEKAPNGLNGDQM